MICIIDWFAVSFNGYNLDDILESLGLHDEQWEVKDWAFWGYRKMLQANGISVMWDHGREELNKWTTLSLSGQGCRYWELRSGSSMQSLLARIADDYDSSRIRITRIDIAIDTPDITMDQVIQDTRDGKIWHEAKRRRIIQDESYTLEVGRKSSLVFIRIYDKAVELRSRGYEVEGNLTRFETMYRDETAKFVFDLLQNDERIMETAAAILKSKLLFLYEPVPYDDGNLARSARSRVAPWYNEFLEEVKAQKIKMDPKPAGQYRDAKRWLQNQCKKKMAIVAEAEGQEEIMRIIKDGKEKFTKTDEHLVRQGKKKM